MHILNVGELEYRASLDEKTRSNAFVLGVNGDGDITTVEDADTGIAVKYPLKMVGLQDVETDDTIQGDGSELEGHALNVEQMDGDTIDDMFKDTYTATFVNYDGTALYASDVIDGKIPVYGGSIPTHPDTDMYIYTFAGWVPELASQHAATTYTATFTESINPDYRETYTIVYVNYDGTELYRVTVSEGITPIYVGESPTRPEDTNRYVFTGWSPVVDTAVSDVTYTATYDAIPLSHSVRLKFSKHDFNPATDYPGTCPDCNGKGYPPCYYCRGTGIGICSTCHGSGAADVCPDCEGRGYTYTNTYVACETCSGTGLHGGTCNVCNGTGFDETACTNCNGVGYLSYSYSYYSGYSSSNKCSRCSGTGVLGHAWPDEMSINAVDGDENAYDFVYQSNDWSGMFTYLCLPNFGNGPTATTSGDDGTFEVISANLAGVTDVSNMFAYSGVAKLCDLDLSTCDSMQNMCGMAVLLENIPSITVGTPSDVIGMFCTCINVKHGALSLYNTLKATDAQYCLGNNASAPFYWCGYYMNYTTLDMTATTDAMGTELESIPYAWGGLMLPDTENTIDGWWINSSYLRVVHVDVDAKKFDIYGITGYTGGVPSIKMTASFPATADDQIEAAASAVFEPHFASMTVKYYNREIFMKIKQVDENEALGLSLISMGTICNMSRCESFNIMPCYADDISIVDIYPVMSYMGEVYLCYRSTLSVSTSTETCIDGNRRIYDAGNYVNGCSVTPSAFTADDSDYSVPVTGTGHLPVWELLTRYGGPGIDIFDGEEHVLHITFTCSYDVHSNIIDVPYKFDPNELFGESGKALVVSPGTLRLCSVKWSPLVRQRRDGTYDFIALRQTYTETETYDVGDTIYYWNLGYSPAFEGTATIDIMRWCTGTTAAQYIDSSTERCLRKVLSWSGLENCTDMSNAFSASTIESIPAVWNLPSLTTAGGMFANCTNLTVIPASFAGFGNQLNAAGVDAANMFQNSKGLTNIHLSSMGNITNAYLMFGYITTLTSVTIDDMSSVTRYDAMFSYSTALNYIKLGKVYHTVSCFSKYNGIFEGLSNLRELYLDDVPGFSNVFATESYGLFSNLSSIETVCITGENNHIIGFNYGFGSCKNLTHIDVEGIDALTTLYSAFYDCESLTEIPAWVLNATYANGCNVSSLFAGAINLDSKHGELYSLYVKLRDANAVHNSSTFWTQSTKTGAVADISRIPTSWGGTMEE